MKALLVIDFINEIVNEKGALSKKGYYDFIVKNNTFANLNNAIKTFRETNDKIIFVNLAFKEDYSNQPKNSPLFGKANEFGILKEGTFSTTLDDQVDFEKDDKVIIKSRVSAFYNTELENYLKESNISDLYIAGVSTDLAVEAAVRDSHDRGFNTVVLSAACAAAKEDDHKNSLRTISKIATVI